MLYIIEPRTESDKVEAVGSPDVAHSYAYGENMVTYYGEEESQTLSIGSLVDCNGHLCVVTELVPMKFGRVILTVNAIKVPVVTTTYEYVSGTTVGALMR